MDTNSCEPSVDFGLYDRYLHRLAALKQTGRPPRPRPMTLDQLTRMHAALQDLGIEDTIEHLIPTPKRAHRVYIANGCGFVEWGRYYLQELKYRLESFGMEVFEPFGEGSAEDTPDVLGERNTKAILSCGRLLAICDGPDLDSGCAGEIALAWATGARVDGIRSDVRRAGECMGTPINAQIAYWVKLSGGRIISGIDQLGTLEWPEGERRRDALSFFGNGTKELVSVRKPTAREVFP